ncbi:N-acetylneuraminate synthase [Candidatus Woesearchaeota archaeon]|nr:N-acetylneuraminate synthase [Candidatus Woesearchaeota archaeon]
MDIKIIDRLIGEDNPVFIIAEAGVNHNGSIETAKKLIDAAKESGADAVKFQTFTAKDLVTAEAQKAEYQGKGTQKEILENLELKKEDFRLLKEYCDKKEIIFLSTPHTEDALEFLDDLVPSHKIGSGDLNNLPFLEKVSKKGKPMILSTGMSTLEEVKEAADTIKEHNDQLILLHCTTSYPCERKDVNLNAMHTLREETGCLVGYSDHTLGTDVSLMAANMGAVVIEKHFTLDKTMDGPDHKASLDPSELKELVQKLRKKDYPELDQEILGKDKKMPTEEEKEISKVIRKSIVSASDIPNRTKITEDMLCIKRPGTGIPPKEVYGVIGKIATKNIPTNSIIKKEMIK